MKICSKLLLLIIAIHINLNKLTTVICFNFVTEEEKTSEHRNWRGKTLDIIQKILIYEKTEEGSVIETCKFKNLHM